MKRLLVILMLASSSPVGAQETSTWVAGNYYELREGAWFLREGETDWEIAPGRIFVKFDEPEDVDPGAAILFGLGFERSRARPNVMGSYRFEYPTTLDPLDALRSVLATPGVATAFLDTNVRFLGEPDPYYGEEWHLFEIRAEKAWRITTGSAAVTIAIIDDGIEIEHEDLADAIWSNPNETPGDDEDNDQDFLWYEGGLVDDVVGWDFVDGDNDPRPTGLSDEHGTPVAGMAFATRDNGKGLAGVGGGSSTNGTRLAVLRANIYSDVTDAAEYCWRKGFSIINMSWTNNDTDGSLHALLDSAYADGAILVAASGNTPHRLIYKPASYSSVIAVGGVGEGGEEISESWGPEQELVAPTADGGSTTPLWSTDNYDSPSDWNPGVCLCPPTNNRYVSMFNGTSASAPQVCAVAALLLSHMPGLSNLEVRQRLVESAVDLGDPGFDEVFGYGRVDAYRTLTEWGSTNGSLTWSPSDTHDGVRYVSGDLTIAFGDTLTILPGTVVRIAPDDDLATGTDTQRVEINVEGV